MGKKRFVFISMAFLISIFCLFVSADSLSSSSSVSEKDFNNLSYQKIITPYVDFDLPIYATHYWTDASGDNDLYEIIINNMSIKGYEDKILKITWNDERYINEPLQVHYAFKDGVLDLSGIIPYSLYKYNKTCMDNVPNSVSLTKYQDCLLNKDGSQLTFKNLKVEMGNITNYIEKPTIKDSKIINVSYPIYSWQDFKPIDLKGNQNFIAVDDIEVTACGKLVTPNTVYYLSGDINVPNSSNCITIDNNSITFDLQGHTIYGDATSTSGNVITVYDLYLIEINNTLIMNGVIQDSSNIGIFLDDSCYNSTIKNLSIISTDNFGSAGAYGMSLQSFGNITIEDVTIQNVNSTLGVTYGIKVNSPSSLGDFDSHYSISNLNILNVNYGIATDSTQGALITLDIWNSTTSNIDNFSYFSDGNATINLYNSTGTTSALGYSTINNYWYFQEAVNDTNGDAVNEANITGWDSFGNFVFSILTDTSGFSDLVSVLSYVTNVTGVFYYSNFEVNTTSGNYLTQSTSYNLTDNAFNFTTLQFTTPSVTIFSPENINYGYNDSIYLNYSALSDGAPIGVCWFNVVNSSAIEVITDNNITDCLNTTFGLPDYDDDYTLNLYANDTQNHTGNASISFGIRTESPAIVLLSPLDNSWVNYNSNIYFNYSAIDSDGIDNCTLLGDFNGSYEENYSWNPYDSSNYTALNLIDGNYTWNIKCSDTIGNEGFGLSNYSLGVDTLTPTGENLSITTTIDSQTITFLTNVSDLNLYSCKYSIYNSTDGIDGSNENVSFTCNDNTTAVTTLAPPSDFTLFTYAIDYAGNELTQNLSFSTSKTAGGTTTGGGSTTIIFEGNISWSMKTETGNTAYSLQMIPGTSRTGALLFTNDGANERNITISCEGNLCEYLQLDSENVTLSVGQTKYEKIGFLIQIPSDIETDTLGCNLIGTDELKLKNAVSIDVKLGAFGFLVDLALSLATPSILIISFGVWLISSFVFVLLFKQTFNKDWGLPVGVLLGLLVTILVLILNTAGVINLAINI